MKSIQHQLLNLPPQAPVMFLPNSAMLPHVLLPLYIFEPRYRAMLAHCLEESRMFCIALLKPGVSEVQSGDDYFHIAGIGLVRACVAHEDGTSHLVLQGLSRVRLHSFVQESPFRIAEVRELNTVPGGSPEMQERVQRIRYLCDALLPESGAERDKLSQELARIDDAGMLCDVVAHTFLREAHRQQEVLEELEVEGRVAVLLHHLEREAA